MNGTHVQYLVYADVLVIVDMTERGLQKKMDIFYNYCLNKRLTVNLDKTKIMVIGKGKGEFNWNLGGNRVDVVE